MIFYNEKLARPHNIRPSGLFLFVREPLGADGRQVGTGAGGILSARRVKPVVCD
jgi:hypothetical protein